MKNSSFQTAIEKVLGLKDVPAFEGVDFTIQLKQWLAQQGYETETIRSDRSTTKDHIVVYSDINGITHAAAPDEDFTGRAFLKLVFTKADADKKTAKAKGGDRES